MHSEGNYEAKGVACARIVEEKYTFKMLGPSAHVQ